MNTQSSILQKIIHTKTQEVAKFLLQNDKDALLEQAKTLKCRGFKRALQQHNKPFGVIAEIKKASPSKGIICQNFKPDVTAKAYEDAGAACLSVLTDRQYFLGDDRYLMDAKNACSLPILRKDFIIDPVQISHAKVLGADCILLIVACLDDKKLHTLHDFAMQLGFDVLIEIHNEAELKRAQNLTNSAHNIFGINNRNLNTFSTDINTSITLAQKIYAKDASALVVSESGIHTKSDIDALFAHNLHHFLIGEQFMKTDHPGQALADLFSQF